MSQTTITKPCPRCGTLVEFEPISGAFAAMFSNVAPICDPCAEAQEIEFAAKQRESVWEDMVRIRLPDRYRKATEDRVSLFLRPVLTWDRKTHPNGLGIVGPSNAGKSSALGVAVQQWRIPFLWWSGTEARDIAMEASSNDGEEWAKQQWRHASTVPLLVIDDIAQARMTDAWSSRLLDLLTKRNDQCRPTMWTSQVSLSHLRRKIESQNHGPDAQEQAQAISRRLGQDCLLIQL